MFIDTHAHLNFKEFDNDFDDVIKRASKAKVKVIINVGSDLKTSKRAVEIAQKQENAYAAIGLHPIHVKQEKWDEEAFMKLAKDKKVVAIGETGLDYYYDQSKADMQKEVFQKSLRLATILGKPVILHSREAAHDLIMELMVLSPPPKGVMHCFPGDWNLAKVILDLDLYLSFTGLITFSKNYANLEVIEKAPLEKILIETDCPYMTPVPYRGERNEPAFVVEVARKIAEIKKIPLKKVEEQTSKNTQALFGLNLDL